MDHLSPAHAAWSVPLRYFDCSACEAWRDFMKTVLFVGAALAFATAGFAQNQTPTPTTTPTQNPNRSQTQPATQSQFTSSGSEDIEFILDAAKGGMAEVELGKLAANRAQNDDVKKF